MGTELEGPAEDDIDYSELPLMDVSLGNEFRRGANRYPAPERLYEVRPGGLTHRVQIHVADQEADQVSTCLLQDVGTDGICFHSNSAFLVGDRVELVAVRLSENGPEEIRRFQVQINRQQESAIDHYPREYGGVIDKESALVLIRIALESNAYTAAEELGIELSMP